jgi:hypothetical protein
VFKVIIQNNLLTFCSIYTRVPIMCVPCIIPDRIEEADVHCQTDAFLDRPPTPLFIPAKTGLDVATQIKDGEVSAPYWTVSTSCKGGLNTVNSINLYNKGLMSRWY